MGRHSTPGWIARICRKLRSDPLVFVEQFRFGKLVKMVDRETREVHLLTRDYEPLGDDSYVALCGKNFLPASMVEPGRGPCVRCFDHVIRDQ